MLNNLIRKHKTHSHIVMMSFTPEGSSKSAGIGIFDVKDDTGSAVDVSGGSSNIPGFISTK